MGKNLFTNLLSKFEQNLHNSKFDAITAMAPLQGVAKLVQIYFFVLCNNQIIGHLPCSNRQKTHVNGLRVWSSDHPHLQEEVHLVNLLLMANTFLSLSYIFWQKEEVVQCIVPLDS